MLAGRERWGICGRVQWVTTALASTRVWFCEVGFISGCPKHNKTEKKEGQGCAQVNYVHADLGRYEEAPE